MNKLEFENFNPIDFLNIAFELKFKLFEFETPSSSVKRTIFGRIYYAVFIFVRESLSKNTNYVSNPFGEHNRLPHYIKSRGPFDEEINEKIHTDLINLKKLRHQSDYYLEVPLKGTIEYDRWLFNDIDYAFDVANNIIEKFSSLFNQ